MNRKLLCCIPYRSESLNCASCFSPVLRLGYELGAGLLRKSSNRGTGEMASYTHSTNAEPQNPSFLGLPVLRCGQKIGVFFEFDTLKVCLSLYRLYHTMYYTLCIIHRGFIHSTMGHSNRIATA